MLKQDIKIYPTKKPYESLEFSKEKVWITAYRVMKIRNSKRD